MKRTKYVVSLYLIILFTFFSTGLAYGAENLNEVRNLIKTRYYQDVGDEVLNKSQFKKWCRHSMIPTQPIWNRNYLRFLRFIRR